MKQKLYQVDAFADNVFEGNPAAVCILEKWLPDDLMQNIAMENNLAETAFLVPTKDGFDLRWFTPLAEVDLCGHATLASAHIIFTATDYSKDTILFDTRSGILSVSKYDDRYMMDFPSDNPEQLENFSEIEAIMNIEAIECFKGKDDYLIIVKDQRSVLEVSPNFREMSNILSRGVIVSSTGKDYDFVSRCFFPNFGIDEDPVTGSAHTLMTPYWAEKLGKNQLTAMQISKRGGKLICTYKGERTEIIGKAVTYLEGWIEI